QCSIPNAQFSSEVDVGLPSVPPHTCGRFLFRMRIEHWELRIGQILSSPHSAMLFLGEPLAQTHSTTLPSCVGQPDAPAQRGAGLDKYSFDCASLLRGVTLSGS